jgi:PII-like signaling protein
LGADVIASASLGGFVTHRGDVVFWIGRIDVHYLISGCSLPSSLCTVWGFHGDHEPHGDKLLSLSRHVPVVTVITDTPANIAESFDVVDELTRDQGLVTSEMVPALVSDEGDNGQGRPHIAHYRY